MRISGMLLNNKHLVINGLVTPPQPVGIGNYIRELVHALQVYRPGLRITIIGFKNYENTLFSGVTLSRTTQVLELPIAYSPRFLSLPWTVLWMRFKLNRLLNKLDADVFWHPNTAYLPKLHTPTIVTIHDLLECDTNEYGFASSCYRKWVLGKLDSRASAIITVSDFSAERIQFHYPNLHSRIHVIPPFVKIKASTEQVGKKKLVLCVSNMKPYKNLITLIQAFQESELPKNGWKLVICGNITDDYKKANGFYGDNTIITTGYIDESSLEQWYKRAAVYVSPSTYEGFDLPVWEAKNSSCKLVLSNIEVHQSSQINAEFLFDQNNRNELISQLNQLLTQH
jgi:glycosyltransferase involved in cell wall biosynthesis